MTDSGVCEHEHYTMPATKRRKMGHHPSPEEVATPNAVDTFRNSSNTPGPVTATSRLRSDFSQAVTKQKNLVFRITSLLASQTNDALVDFIRKNLLKGEEQSQLKVTASIVPSCSNNEQERVALVEFGGRVPDFLSALVANPLEDWQVKIGLHSFIPLKQISQLPQNLPYCHTMTYGYNSKLLTHGIDTIMDYSRGLMEALKKIRSIEECLIKAVQTNEDNYPTIATLHKATYGMLLFGTLHKGLVVNDIEKMLASRDNHPRSALLQQIRVKSDLLENQLADFKNLVRDRKIVSFYERGQTRQLQFDSNSQRWEKTGDFITKVDNDSALLQLPDFIEDKIPLDSDHSIIVKFNNRNNIGYSSALPQVQRTSTVKYFVPYISNPDFVGRSEILKILKDQLGHMQQASGTSYKRYTLRFPFSRFILVVLPDFAKRSHLLYKNTTSPATQNLRLIYHY
ncbi:hypothetical protein N5P37_011250 [Trichoderma harzianum]|nr:hypothetical protein N5P37_011250 [Trichoderma harzianum]